MKASRLEVKSFWCSTPNALDQEVNRFLEENPNVEVNEIKFSSFGAYDQDSQRVDETFSAMIVMDVGEKQ